MSERPGHADLDVADRLRQVRRGRIDYLSRIARAEPHAVVESRWLGGGGWPVRQFLLGRVDAPDAAAVNSRAGLLREAMLGLPTYLSAEPLDSATEILDVLRPFAPNHRAELRKRRVRVQPADTSRRDLPPDGIQVVVPFPTGAAPLLSLEAVLAAASYPTMVGVALRPFRLGAAHRAAIEDRRRWYRALSAQTTMTTLGLYGQREVVFAPVPLAAEAADLIADAARRYLGDTFGIRIGFASAGPLPAPFVTALADLLVPLPEPGDPGAVLLADLADSRAGRIQRPVNPGQVAVFDRNLATMDLVRWAPVPEAWLEVLASVVDSTEAATVFRLPGDVAEEPTPGGGSADGHPSTGQSVCPVPIGWGVRDGARTERISVEAAGPLAVLGVPGSGVTRTVQALLWHLWVRRRVPFLVIESGAGAYRQLLTEPDFADLVVLTAGLEHVAPLRLCPGDLPVDRLRAALAAAFREEPPDAGVLLASLGRDGTLADTAYRSDDPALRRWCGQRCQGAAGTVFDTRAGLPAARLADRPLVVELAGLPARDDRAFAAALLLSQVASVEQARGPHVTVVHDAHELLDGTAQPLLARIGHGTTLAADPAELAPALLPSDGTLVLHRGSYHRLGLPDPGTLGPGRALVGNPGHGWQDVVLDAAPMPDTTEPGAVVSDATVRARFTREIEGWRDSLVPYRDCEGCRFRCELRAASLQAVDHNRVQTLLAVLRSFPASDPLGAGAWWQHLDEHLAGYGPQHRDPLRSADQRACLLMHLHRAATGRPAGFWVRRYRQVFCR